MAGRLDKKRIIITGGVNNIGKEAARHFVAEGAKVVIGDINEAAGRATVAELGPSTLFVKVDVTDEASVRQLIESCGHHPWRQHLLAHPPQDVVHHFPTAQRRRHP